MLAALRGMLKEAEQLGFIPIDDYHRATVLQPVKGYSLPKGQVLGSDELSGLLEACVRGNHEAVRSARRGR